MMLRKSVPLFLMVFAVMYALASAGVVVLQVPSSAFAQEDDTPTCVGIPATIFGTPGNDVLVGTEGRDVIAGLAGADRISGLGGADLICGDEGHDRMGGGAGNDQMFGGAGDDRMGGGADDDFLESRDGIVNNDSLDGGDGTEDFCTSDPDPEENCELDS
jgi:Ca2+-binding RTX toxin-like protein